MAAIAEAVFNALFAACLTGAVTVISRGGVFCSAAQFALGFAASVEGLLLFPRGAFLAAVAFGGLIGILTAIPLRRLRGDYLLVATFALHLIVRQAFAFPSRWTTGPEGRFVPSTARLGLPIATVWMVVLAGVAYGVTALFDRAQPRLALKLISIGDHMAASVGVSSEFHFVCRWLSATILATGICTIWLSRLGVMATSSLDPLRILLPLAIVVSPLGQRTGIAMLAAALVSLTAFPLMIAQFWSMMRGHTADLQQIVVGVVVLYLFRGRRSYA